MKRLWLIAIAMLIWAPHLIAQETAEEWTKRLGHVENRATIISTLGQGEGLYALEKRILSNYPSYADFNRGVIYTLTVGQENADVVGIAFVSQRMMDKSLSKIDYEYIYWRFPYEMKPFTGEMPFGLRMGMSKEEVKDIIDLAQPVYPPRYAYTNLISLGEESELILYIDEDEGLYYLSMLSFDPELMGKLHQTYGDNAMEAIRAGIEASMLSEGYKLVNAGDALYAFLNRSDTQGLEADILGTDLIDRNAYRWRATWCEQHPEFLTPRFQKLKDMVLAYAVEEMDYNEEITVIQVEGDHPNDIFWVREDEAETFRDSNQGPIIRLSMDSEAGHINLEAISPDGMTAPPLEKPVCR